MKRTPELTDLSRDHHHALVLARRCLQAADVVEDERLAELWADTKSAFAAELAPHFAVEERLLLPALASAGETALVERTRKDHSRLRVLIGLAAERDVLREFGELLSAHVRFEEQVLFPRAEQVVGLESLAAVATASALLETAKQRRARRPLSLD